MKSTVMQWQKMLVFMLALSLIVGAVPFYTYAAGEEITCETEIVVSDLEFPDSEEMFDYYLDSLFYPENIPALMGTAAGEKLTGDTKAMYDAMIPIIKDIASGNRESTQIGFGRSITYGGETFPSDVAMTFTQNSIDSSALFKALLLDLPYEMYWNDKVTGCKFKYFKSSNTLVHVTIRFEVSDVFQGSTTYSVDTTKSKAAAAAVANANAIVENNKDKKDYEKLVAYRDAICGLVSYDNAAAGSGSFSDDNRAWQLVNVFDGDDSTNVVCEGYSKAFHYLCDLSSFAGDVDCYCVSGVLSSNSGSGGHMWNIVTLEGNNYLVDVTNSDTGTVGYYDGSLFLAGSSIGSADTSYTFKSVSFSYDDSIKALWGTDASSFLTLAATNYEPKTTYSVTYQLDNINSDGALFAAEGSDYTAVLKADAGYALPDSLRISIGGSEITGYTYDASSGALTIPAGSITGNILIAGSAACVHASYQDGVCSICGRVCEHETYKNGFCTVCGEKEPVIEAPVPEITLMYPSLSFESEVFYNVYFTASDIDDVEEMGLITWYTKPASQDAAIYENAEAVIPGAVYNANTNMYMVRSEGVPAKQLGDNLYMRVYAKLSDGSYVYSNFAYYNAKLYANDILTNSSNANMKALVVAMLNYGASAQVHFNHNADKLMNKDLTAEQKALVNAYSDDMISSLVTPDSTKTANFVYNKGYSGGYPSVSFEGAFAINFYLTPKYAVTGDFTLYCWDLATYNAVDVLTEDNATATVSMSKANGSQYVGSFAGLAAKQIDETVIAVAVYESNGTRYVSPVLNYSIGAYCQDQIANGSETMKAFAKETAVYGYYAENYFA